MTHHNELPIRSEVYGTTQDGQEVRRFILRNEMLQLSVIEYGAILENLVWTSNGKGYSLCHRLQSLDAYESDELCLGAVVGPVVDYVNDGNTSAYLKQSIHHGVGGEDGLHRMVWQGREAIDQRGPCLELETVHSDGMNGELGNLYVRVRFILGQSGVCHIEYEVLSDAVRAINLTHHTYLQLPHMSQMPATMSIMMRNAVVDVPSRQTERPSFSSDQSLCEGPVKFTRIPIEELTERRVEFADNEDDNMLALAQLDNGIVSVSVHSDQRALYVRKGVVAQVESAFSVCLAPHARGTTSTGHTSPSYLLEAGQLYRQKSEIRVEAI